MEDTVLNETCIHSHIVMEQNVVKRKTVNDTDTGKVLRENIAELEELLQKNPEICIVTNELGYGVVPIEPFDRKWREKTGRICTELAAKADSVTRVVCGIGILLKGEEKHD